MCWRHMVRNGVCALRGLRFERVRSGLSPLRELLCRNKRRLLGLSRRLVVARQCY